MYTDLTFNQAKIAVDKMSVFDQHQILDGLYQDVVSDDSNGNLLNTAGNIVSRRSAEGHIPCISN